MKELKTIKTVDPQLVRFCSNNRQHRVFGYKNWQWYCSECGMQWIMNVYSGNIQSYQYLEDGTKELVQEVSFTSFVEKKNEH